MQKQHILCVEDNPGDARIIRELFNEHGREKYEITVVDCLSKVELVTAGTRYNCILLDLNLPDSTGIETVEKMQILVADTPIIVLTGTEDEELSTKIMQSGAQDYLMKNHISGELLIHTLRYARDRFGFVKKMEESEKRFRTLIEQNSDGIVVINQKGIMEFVNPSGEAILSQHQDELIGKSFGFPVVQEKLSEISILGKAGKVTSAEMRISEVLWEDKPCYLATLRDVSERIEMRKKEYEQRQQLEVLNGQKDKFFSIIAHDLRGPFSAFLGLTELLVEDLADLSQEELQKIALTLQKSATNLYGLLNNLLEWSRHQQGKIPYEPEQFILLPEVREIVEQALESAQKKEIQIKHEIDEDLMVFADKQMFHTIVRNLLFNAIKFTQIGGLINIKAKHSYNGKQDLSIQDNGIGMSDKLMGNLFKIDKNTSRKGTNNEPSTGLGLILCKEFMDKHGGEIRIESKVGKGSTFSVFLPSIPAGE